MTRFTGGPADGQSLLLRRAPLYLRVVVDAAGHLDALDELTDCPRPGESVSVYRRTASEGRVHLQTQDPRTGRRGGGWFQMARYTLCGAQPGPEVTHDQQRWRDWALAQLQKESAQ